MAIYHCSISNVSRSAGSRSTATASYITGEKIHDTELHETYNYGRQERVIEYDTILPPNAPPEFKNPADLFNSIEAFEKNSNARPAKKIEVALPRECTLEQQRAIVKNFIEKNITSDSYACTYAIHYDKDNNNPHAHILIANRQLIDGKWSTKSKKEYALDENNQRIPILDESGNQKLDSRNRKQWKRVNTFVNPLDKKEKLLQMRASWADCCNDFLDEHQKITHLSFKARNLEEAPTIHEGYSAREIEKRGGISQICKYNRDVKKFNAEIQKRKNAIINFNNKIEKLENKRKVVAIDEYSRKYQTKFNRHSELERSKKSEIFRVMAEPAKHSMCKLFRVAVDTDKHEEVGLERNQRNQMSVPAHAHDKLFEQPEIRDSSPQILRGQADSREHMMKVSDLNQSQKTVSAVAVSAHAGSADPAPAKSLHLNAKVARTKPVPTRIVSARPSGRTTTTVTPAGWLNRVKSNYFAIRQAAVKTSRLTSSTKERAALSTLIKSCDKSMKAINTVVKTGKIGSLKIAGATMPKAISVATAPAKILKEAGSFLNLIAKTQAALESGIADTGIVSMKANVIEDSITRQMKQSSELELE